MSIVQLGTVTQTRARQATNYAIDRNGMCGMLDQTGQPARPAFSAGGPIVPAMTRKAKPLLEQAGYDGPIILPAARRTISSSGSRRTVSSAP